jgi:hypothetical protein
MTRLALAPPWIAVLPFDLRYATLVLPVAIGRPGSSPPRSISKQAFNAHRQQTASDKIPIASDARPRHISRGFLPWRFAYAGPRCAPRHHHGAGIRKPSHNRRSRIPRHTSGLPLISGPAQRSQLLRLGAKGRANSRRAQVVSFTPGSFRTARCCDWAARGQKQTERRTT